MSTVEEQSERERAKLTLNMGVGDIQTLFDITDDEAEAFILRHQNKFQERMTELAWDVLTDLGVIVDKLKPIDLWEDEDDADETQEPDTDQ